MQVIDLNAQYQALKTQLAAFTDLKYCVTCANGAGTPQIACMAAGVGEEDAGRSFGAVYHGARTCSLGHFVTTGFFSAKALDCYGTDRL